MAVNTRYYGYHGHFSHGHSSILSDSLLFTFLLALWYNKNDGIQTLWDFFLKNHKFFCHDGPVIKIEVGEKTVYEQYHDSKG